MLRRFARAGRSLSPGTAHGTLSGTNMAPQLTPHVPGGEGDAGPPGDDAAARIALGEALSERAPEVARACNERLRQILGLGPDEPLPEVNAASASELATGILGRYLTSGAPATSDEAAVLARPGSLALHETSVTTLVKLVLYWRDTTLLTLRDIASQQGTAAHLLRAAEEVVRSSCDASLVRMMKRFDRRKEELEALLADEHRRLVHEARHDQLTGLVNRRAFLELVRQASGTHRPDELVALMYMDLDGFKEVNDTHGHAFGDLVLQAVAERLSGLLRPTDTAGRLGGDEFVVLCGNVRGGEPTAVGVARRLCDTMALPIEVSGRPVSCPASIGLVCTSEPAEPESLLARADAALYRAKRAGKGRVVLG